MVVMRAATSMVVLICVCETPAGGAELSNILHDWHVRREAMRRVHVVAEGTGCDVKGSKDLVLDSMRQEGAAATELSAPCPPEDRTFPVRYEMLLDFDAGCARYEVSESRLSFATGKHEPLHEIRLRDGTETQVFVPTREGGDGQYRQPQLYGKRSSRFANKFFLMHEFAPLIATLSLPWETVSVEQMQLPLEGFGFVVGGHGRLAGKEHVILRSRPIDKISYYEAWVDTAQQSSVVRWALWQNGRETYRYDLSYSDGNGTITPARWDFSAWTDGRLNKWERVSIVECSYTPEFPAGAFHVTPSPGMIVFEETTGRHYVKGATDSGDQSVEDVFGHARAESRRVVWVFVGIGVIVCCAAFLCWRLRKRKQSV